MYKNKMIIGLGFIFIFCFSFYLKTNAYSNGGYINSAGTEIGFSVEAGSVNHFTKSPNGYYARLICGDEKFYFGSSSVTTNGKISEKYYDCEQYGNGTIDCSTKTYYDVFTKISGSRKISDFNLPQGIYNCYFSYYIHSGVWGKGWDDKPGDKVTFTVANKKTQEESKTYCLHENSCKEITPLKCQEMNGKNSIVDIVFTSKSACEKKINKNNNTNNNNNNNNNNNGLVNTCSGYTYNGGCYKLDEFNCKYFGFSWENGSCNQNKKCGVGNYYNNDSSKAPVGCYKADKDNCTTFGYVFENGECNYNKKNNSSGAGTTSTDYKVSLDFNYGSDGTNLLCGSNLTKTNDNPIICEGNINGSTITFPNESKNAHLGDYYLLGWSNTIENNKIVCSSPNNTIVKNKASASSNNEFYACYQDTINGIRYALNDASADGQTVQCGNALKISYCYQDSNGTGYCHYTENGTATLDGIVYRDRLMPTEPTNCNEINEESSEEQCVSSRQRNIEEGRYTFNMCLDKNYDDEDEVIEDANELVKCESGLVLDEEYTRLGNGSVDDDYIEVTVKCVDEDDLEEDDNDYENSSSDINLSVTSGNVGSNGEGVIRVNATSKDGNIEKYYYSESYKTPTSRSNWNRTNGGSFTITTTPGIIYIWVMDSEGNISKGIGGAVFDTVNTNTTLGKLELYDANGNVQTPNSNTAYKVDGITSSDYVRLSNRLNNESKIADNGFNPFDMEYKLEVSSPTISVYATLTSTDANYVSGYEPRTVNLDYGINTILIKIQNNEGKIRTYTILVTRTDDRTADNTLKEISVDVGNIEFNSNKAEYKIEIPENTKNVNVSATIASDKATYVSGYEPGNVKITSESTVKLIKVKSQTGSIRTYVLTFVKENADIITDESLQLFSLNIPGVRLAFEKNIANYNVSVGYTTDVIDINAVVNNKDSKSIIKLKRQSDTDYNIVSNKGINLDVGENFVEIIVMRDDGSYATYRITIIRKEFGLGLADDTTLSELKVLGYDIDFEPTKKEYTVRIKQEKTLVITAIPNSDRSEVFIRGNDELTGFSTVRVKVVAENGDYETYSIDIKKDAFNKTIEIAAIVVGVVIILGSSCIIIIKNKNKKRREYIEE